MIKKILFIGLLFILATVLKSQSCLPQGITFNTQVQIDNFQTNYPGCTIIEGDVKIEGSNIANLNGLNVLTACYGEFNINNCVYLTNLSGLENLSSMGALNILFNSSLIDLSGLQGLTSISTGHLFIYENESLTTLSGLNNLSIVEDGIEIIDNAALININGLENISLTKEIIIESNYSLSDLLGLENLTTVINDFILHGNNSLSDLSGLENLTKIEGRLSIKNNNTLISLSGLNSLDSISHLYIYDNPSLTTCNIGSICNFLSNPTGSVNFYDNATGCNSPTEIANLCGISLPCLPYGNYYFFTQNDIDNFQNNYPNCTDIMGIVKISGQNINNLSGLSLVHSISGDLFITFNSTLFNLSGLDSLTSVGGNFVINWNSILNSISALNNLDSIGIGIQIWGNNLNTIDGLNNLSYVGNYFALYSTEIKDLLPLSNLSYLGGHLRLDNNDNLIDLSGLENLSSIGGDLEIQRNDSLINLVGLENITTIGGNLSIGVMPYGGNQSLRSLSGLDNLTSLGGWLTLYNNNTLNNIESLASLYNISGVLQIFDNYSLTSLEGFENINSESISDLYIFDNHSLSYCEVKSVCNYIATPNGSLSINNNALGCNTQTEVEFACSVLVSNINMESEIEIYPNPAKTNISISTKNDVVIKELIFYNQLGQKILQKTDITNKINISTLGQGLHIIELVTDKNIVREKLIIK